MSPSTPKFERISEETIQAVQARARSVEGVAEILTALGSSEVKVSGNGTRGYACCVFHNEKTPSLHFRDEGNWHCFGCGEKGTDGIALLARFSNRDYKDGKQFIPLIKELAGIFGSGVTTTDTVAAYQKSGNRQKTDQFLSWADQIACHNVFENIVTTIDPDSVKRGLHWMEAARGIDPLIAQKNGRYFHLDYQFIDKFNGEIKNFSKDEFKSLLQIGVLNSDIPDRPILLWRGEGVVMGTKGETESLLDLRMRQFKSEIKYMATRKQGVANAQGVVIKPRSVPFGVGILEECAAKKQEILIVEGAVKALGAQCMGRYAIATNGRPGFKNASEVGHDSSQIVNLTPLLPKLRRCHKVVVCSDIARKPHESEGPEAANKYDDEMKLNHSHAWELAKWLQTQNINACAERTSVSSRGYCGQVPYVHHETGLVENKFVKDWDDALLLIKNNEWIPQSMVNGAAKVPSQKTVSAPQQQQLNQSRNDR